MRVELQTAVGALLRLLDTAPNDEFPDLLTGVGQLRSIFQGIDVPLEGIDLAPIARLRSELLRTVVCDDADDARDLLNELAMSYGVTPQLNENSEVEFQAEVRGTAAALAALFVQALMELHTRGWTERIHQCEAVWCWNFFLSAPKSRNQRYCSSTCATRMRSQRRRDREFEEPWTNSESEEDWWAAPRPRLVP